MKTLRKALLGLLFLAPLLLPSQTKAGPFDDWIHSLFSEHHQPAYQPIAPQGRPFEGLRGGPANHFRAYDPFSNRNHPGGSGNPLGDPTGPGGNGNAVPLDGGLMFLLIAGLGLGVLKVYERRRRSGVTMMQ